LYTKISGVIASDRDFRLITLIQDVGSGKTHLSLHIRGLQELSDNSAMSYVDLSQISPRDMHSLYRAILEGFTQEHHNDIRRAVLNFLKDKAESNIKNAKKVLIMEFSIYSKEEVWQIKQKTYYTTKLFQIILLFIVSLRKNNS